MARRHDRGSPARQAATTLVGAVTRDPKPPEVPDGIHTIEPRAAFGLSVSARQRMSHFEVRCRGELAENVLASVREGDHVIITGEIEQREWNGPGKQHSSRTFLMADEIGLALSFHRIDAPTDADEEENES